MVLNSWIILSLEKTFLCVLQIQHKDYLDIFYKNNNFLQEHHIFRLLKVSKRREYINTLRTGDADLRF